MRLEVCEKCGDSSEYYLKIDDEVVCLSCENGEKKVKYRKRYTGRGECWLKVEGRVGIELIAQMCVKKVWYNGGGYFKCENRKRGDDAVRELRREGRRVERCTSPDAAMLTHTEKMILGFSLMKEGVR